MIPPAILRSRLTPSASQTATLLAETFDPARAVTAGLLDEVVAPEHFDERVTEVATVLSGLDQTAHRETKRRARATFLGELAAATDADEADFAARLAATG